MTDAMHSPRRFWWLKRLALLYVLIVATMVLTHWQLGRSAEAALREREAEWKTAGLATAADVPEQVLNNGFQPLDWSFVPKEPDNAAAVYVRAFEAMPPPAEWTQAQQDYESAHGEPLTADEARVARSLVSDHAEALALARKAAEMPRVDWNLPTATTGLFVPYGEFRALAIRLKDKFLVAQYDGDVGEAALALRDIIALRDAMAECGPAVITLLVAGGLDLLATETVNDLIHHDPPGHDAEATRAAWHDARPEVQALIDRLLVDEAARQDWLVRCIHTERVWLASIDYANYYGIEGFSSRFIQPFATRDALRLADRAETIVEAVCDKAELQPLLAQLRGRPLAAPALDSLAALTAHPLLTLVPAGAPVRYVSSEYAARTSRNAAATLLAIRLYEADHDGQLPPTLEVLVPDYLPSVPSDPTDPANGSLKYDPNVVLPLIYANGIDGADDGGDIGPSGSRFGDAWGGIDAVWPLRPSPEPGVNVWDYLYSLPSGDEGVVDDLKVEDEEHDAEADQDEQDRPGKQ